MKTIGVGAILRSPLQGTTVAPLPSPPYSGERGRDEGGQNASRNPAVLARALTPSPQPLSPRVRASTGERGDRAQRFSDDHPLWRSPAHPSPVKLDGSGDPSYPAFLEGCESKSFLRRRPALNF